MIHQRDFNSIFDAPQQAAHSKTPVHTLFGDYELLIDEALDGDKALKVKVAQADAFDRGGLAVLKNAIKNRGIVLTGKLADILHSIELDHGHWEERQKDLNRIYARPNGRYQVQVTVEHNLYTKTFPTLAEAQDYRDRMLIMAVMMDREE